MSLLALFQVLAGRAVLAPIEAAVNGLLRKDPETLARLAALAGKVIGVEIVPFSARVYVAPGAGGLVLSTEERTPDTWLRGTPPALLSLLTQTASEALFRGDVEIAGDMDVAQRLRAILTGIDIDWEEELSQLLGDVLAHQLGRGARGVLSWGAQAREALALTLAEYLQEESRLCPRQDATEAFLDEVDTLRMDVDRLEQRIHRLQAHRLVDTSSE